MKAIRLYKQLEEDFITPEMSDDWVSYMQEISNYLSDEFKHREMGLVCDFTKEINKVYTAVFPSDKVLKKVIGDNIRNAMIFVHHPMNWDVTNTVSFFSNMSPVLLEKLKEENISIYNLHSPLDNFSNYSTSKTLSNALSLQIKESFAPYHGGLAGVITKTTFNTVEKLKEHTKKVLKHRTALYQYGNPIIENSLVAIVAGGGNDLDVLQEMLEKKIQTLITGVSVKNIHNQKAHEFAKKNEINIIGGTHYSTEKFACLAMVKYFNKLSLPAEFISDQPMLEDL